MGNKLLNQDERFNILRENKASIEDGKIKKLVAHFYLN